MNYKRKVSLMLRQAVSKGIIKKPDYCSRCGKKIPKHLLCGHHNDYNKPFDVKWLCHKCHTARELELGNKVCFVKGDKRITHIRKYKKGNVPWVKGKKFSGVASKKTLISE